MAVERQVQTEDQQRERERVGEEGRRKEVGAARGKSKE